MQAVMTMPHTQSIANINSISNEGTSAKADSVDLPKEQDIESKQLQKNDDLKPDKITEEFNKLSSELNLDVKFAYNEKIDTVYINVTDKSTGRVIRKLPTEEAMKIKESMQDLVGVLFDKKG